MVKPRDTPDASGSRQRRSKLYGIEMLTTKHIPDRVANISTPQNHHYELIKIKILFLKNGISAFHRIPC